MEQTNKNLYKFKTCYITGRLSQPHQADRPNPTSGAQVDPHHSEAHLHAAGLQDQGQAQTLALIQTPQVLGQAQTQTRGKAWGDCFIGIENYKKLMLRGL